MSAFANGSGRLSTNHAVVRIVLLPWRRVAELVLNPHASGGSTAAFDIVGRTVEIHRGVATPMAARH